MKNTTGYTLGDALPDFDMTTSCGDMKLKEYFNGNWGLLVSHPDDFTPVCTTEMGELANLDNAGEFSSRNVKVIGLSCNDTESHVGWIADINAYANTTVSYPIIADKKRTMAMALGMLSADDVDKAGLPMTVRSVFIMDPDMKIKFMATYPASTGRNMVELIRIIDSLQLTFNKSVATPVNWIKGGKTCILPSVSNEEAAKKYPGGFDVVELPSGKPYLRMTADPTC